MDDDISVDVPEPHQVDDDIAEAPEVDDDQEQDERIVFLDQEEDERIVVLEQDTVDLLDNIHVDHEQEEEEDEDRIVVLNPEEIYHGEEELLTANDDVLLEDPLFIENAAELHGDGNGDQVPDRDQVQDRDHVFDEDDMFDEDRDAHGDHVPDGDPPDDFDDPVDVENEDYRDILSDLSEEWLLTEVSHHVSKEASNSMWKIANDLFHRMYTAKANEGRKIPQFCHLRRKLYEDKVPKIKMEFAYQSKDDGSVTVVEDVSTTPLARFPPSTHRKLYEIASVDVSIKLYTIFTSINYCS